MYIIYVCVCTWCFMLLMMHVPVCVCVGMTAIDMALSSSYKKLASRLAEWAYVEDRTKVRLTHSCTH